MTHWGDLESEEEEESSEEEEEEEDRAEVDTESLADGLSSVVSGYSSLPSGLETPEALDLRKGKAGGRALLLSLSAGPVSEKHYGGLPIISAKAIVSVIYPKEVSKAGTQAASTRNLSLTVSSRNAGRSSTLPILRKSI